jgi:hypothetical protein
MCPGITPSLLSLGYVINEQPLGEKSKQDLNNVDFLDK